MLVKMQMIGFKLFGKRDAVGCNINSCYIKSFFRKYLGMTTSAACHIKH